MSGMNADQLKKLIREVPDFPKKGILFYDITTLLKDKTGFAQLIDLFSEHYIGKQIDLILGMEARGFIFGPALAADELLGLEFVEQARDAGCLFHHAIGDVEGRNALLARAAQDAKNVVLLQRNAVRLHDLRKHALHHVGRAEQGENGFLCRGLEGSGLANLVTQRLRFFAADCTHGKIDDMSIDVDSSFSPLAWFIC